MLELLKMKSWPILLALLMMSAAQGPAAQRPSVPLDALPGQTPRATPTSRPTPAATPTATPAPAPARTPAATPTPSPTPTATPSPTATPTPTPTPEIQPPAIEIALDGITVVRSRDYVEGQQALPREHRDPRMVMGFTINVPEGWTIMSVDDCQVGQLMNQQGRPLAVKPPAAPGSLPAGHASVLMVEDRFAAVEVNAELPGREDRQLAHVKASFKLTLGIAQSLRIPQLRARVGQELLNRQQFPDLMFRLERITTDTVALVAFGELSRIGRIDFIGADGRAIEPYGSDVTSSNNPGEPAGRLWRYYFFSLPEEINIELRHFPYRRQAVYHYEQRNVPLP